MPQDLRSNYGSQNLVLVMSALNREHILGTRQESVKGEGGSQFLIISWNRDKSFV